MKKFKWLICFIVAFCMICGVAFVGCTVGEVPTEGTGTTDEDPDKDKDGNNDQDNNDDQDDDDQDNNDDQDDDDQNNNDDDNDDQDVDYSEYDRTVTIATSVTEVTLNNALTFNAKTDTSVTLPTSSEISNLTERTLEGWYVEDANGSIYGSATNGIYTAGTSLIVSTTTTNLVIWPVLKDNFYTLSINDNDTSGMVTDHAGVELGTNPSGYTGYINESTRYNKTDYVEEYVTVGNQTLPDGYWYRTNTNSSIGTLTAGNKYNLFYALTNHGSSTITITLYHCTNGYMDSSTNNHADRTVTIAPDETVYISIYAFDQVTTSQVNFLTVYQLSSSCSDYVLGIRAMIENYTANTVEATVNCDTTGIENFTISGWPTSDTIYAGSSISVPTSTYYTNSTGMTLSGWNYYDENGSLIKTIDIDGSFTVESKTVVLVPVLTEATT